jgi:hypothetical protein
MNKIKSKIIEFLKENKLSEAEQLAKEEGLSSSEWDSILTDYFWDWHTEH